MKTVFDFLLNPHKYKRGFLSLGIPFTISIINIFAHGIYISITLFTIQMYLYYRFFRRTSKFITKLYKKTVWLNNGSLSDTAENTYKLSYYTKLDTRYILKDGNIWYLNLNEIGLKYFQGLYKSKDLRSHHIIDSMLLDYIHINNKKITIKYIDTPIFIQENRNQAIDSLLS